MGSHKLRPTRILFDVSEANQQLFEQFNILRIIEGLSEEEAFAQLVRAEVARNADKLKDRWMQWNDLAVEMGKLDFSVNRVAFWKNSAMGNFVKTDGTDVLYNFDGILAFFQGRGQ
ncbi:MAG: hypothetical protein ABR530_06540 [Pyrinomonadaceae bacterium]